MLEQFGHGGDLRTAEEKFGYTQDQFIDFSSNMNPFGPPAVVEEIMRSSWRELVKYPDPAVRDLRAKLSLRYDIPAESLIVGNGAAELIELIVRVLKPQTVGLARPSFLEYEEAVHKAGGDIHDIMLHAEDAFELKQAAVEQAISSSDLLFLGHPNNPTGKLIPRATLDMLESSGHPLIIDEAFMDFIPDEQEHSMLRKAAHNPNLVVIRSMTKFYSIPGIRLGFMVAHPTIIGAMKQLQVPWSVNYLAQRIGTEVLDDQIYEARTHAWLQSEKGWLTEQLESLGLLVTRSEVNFLLVALSQESGLQVREVQEHMGRQGILIRDASLFKGLDQHYFRVAIRLRTDNERLVAGLRKTIQELREMKGAKG